MKEILRENPQAVREAGLALVEIGALLAAGKVEEAAKRLETKRQAYRAWEELDVARLQIEMAVRERQSLLAIEQIVGEMVAVALASAIRGGIRR